MGKFFLAILGFIQNQKRASFLILAVCVAVALVYFIFSKFIAVMIAIFGWVGLVVGVVWFIFIVSSFIFKSKLAGT